MHVTKQPADRGGNRDPARFTPRRECFFRRHARVKAKRELQANLRAAEIMRDTCSATITTRHWNLRFLIPSNATMYTTILYFC